jgi:hypothetical protein
MGRPKSGSVEEYIREILLPLKRLFGANQVIPEWDVTSGSLDDFTRQLYCPRIDIAVGPFNVNGNITRNREVIDDAYFQHEDLIKKLSAADKRKMLDEHLNKNPRCLLAIEVENRGSRKHRLGSIVNVAALGKVGIIIAFTNESYRSLEKLREYLRFISRVRKIERDISKNVIIISRDNFSRILDECTEHLGEGK